MRRNQKLHHQLIPNPISISYLFRMTGGQKDLGTLENLRFCQHIFSPSPRLPISPSPHLPVSPSPRLPVSLSPRLPVSPSPPSAKTSRMPDSLTRTVVKSADRYYTNVEYRQFGVIPWRIFPLQNPQQSPCILRDRNLPL